MGGLVMYCKKCGKEIGEGHIFCGDCGGMTVPGPRKKMSLWVKILIIIAVISFFAFVGYTMTTALNSAREQARRISCVSNLKSMGMSLKQYAMDFSDAFPEKDGWEGLEQLRVNDYLTDYGVYTCPSTSTSAGEFGPLTKDNCDYIYFGGFKEGATDNSDVASYPLMFDIPGNHSRYINAVFEDGYAQGFNVGKINTCKAFIKFLSKKYKYPPEHLKILMGKAGQLDEQYGLQ
jgi:Protein of unknown function (DUF1559)